MSYRVRTDNFEGPFDLLLRLVARQKIDIESVPVARICDQYLAEVSRMRDVDLDVASDFLLVAATLLELKSQSLLPSVSDALDDELAELDPSEARELLIGKLLTYKQFKNAADMLAERAEARGRMHERTAGPEQRFLAAMPDFLADMTLDAIAAIAAGALGRPDVYLLESAHIAQKPIPLEAHVRALTTRLRAQGRMRFREVAGACAPVAVVVVTFLAALELYKRGEVALHQDEPFGDIEIVWQGDCVEGAQPLDQAQEASAGQAEPRSASARAGACASRLFERGARES